MADVETPEELRWREVATFATGDARLDLHARDVDEVERRRWAEEDAERDSRRIPLGFRAP